MSQLRRLGLTTRYVPAIFPATSLIALDGASSGGLRPDRFFVCHSGAPQGTAKLMRGKTAEDLKLLELLDPVAEAAGYEIVRLRLMGGEKQRRLQIMAERPPAGSEGEGEMNVEDCARLSRRAAEV